MLLNFGVIGLITFQLECMNTLIELHLLQNGFSEEDSGYIYCLLSVGFLLASLSVTLVPASVDKRLLVIVGLVLFSLSFLMMGPTEPVFAGRGMIAASLPISGIANAVAGGRI